jgi:hypothetical protein
MTRGIVGLGGHNGRTANPLRRRRHIRAVYGKMERACWVTYFSIGWHHNRVCDGSTSFAAAASSLSCWSRGGRQPWFRGLIRPRPNSPISQRPCEAQDRIEHRPGSRSRSRPASSRRAASPAKRPVMKRKLKSCIRRPLYPHHAVSVVGVDVNIQPQSPGGQVESARSSATAFAVTGTPGSIQYRRGKLPAGRRS